MNSLSGLGLPQQLSTASGKPRKPADPAAPVADPKPSRVQALEAELQQCYGTYMYCEAADFQSAEERATSRRMSERMGQIGKELAELRGADVLTRENVKAQVDVILERQPLARLGPRAFQAVYPFSRFSGYGVDHPAGRLHDAVRYGALAQEQVDQKVLRSASRRKATAAADDPEVRRAAAHALTQDLPRDREELFPDLKTFLQAPPAQEKALATAVKGLVGQGLIDLTAEDVNHFRRCIYVPGQLGEEARRYRELPDNHHRVSNQDHYLGLMGRLLDQELPYTEEERQQALTCAASRLVAREQELAGRPPDEWSRRRLEEDKQLWRDRGLTEQHLQSVLLGGPAPAGRANSVGESPDWIILGPVKLDKRTRPPGQHATS